MIETQLVIALVNTAITVFALAVMGFPAAVEFGVDDFLFPSLIPVACVLVCIDVYSLFHRRILMM